MALPTLGGYQLDETLGQSALGTTYAGQWRNTAIVVKVIEMGSDLSAEDQRQTQAEFRRRTEAISGLYHPSIIALRDYGQAPPYLYAVSGFQAGGALTDPEGRRAFAAAMEIEQVIHHARQLGDALDEAHRRGVAHGNLKPANIFITETTGTGPLRLAIGDFALVSENVRLTVQPLGQQRVWRYLAPEAPGRAPTPAGDQFALAAICYEWLTGKPAFENVLPGGRRAILLPTEARPSLTVWPALDAVIARGLAALPETRYPDITSFVAALAAITQPAEAAAPAAAEVSAKETRLIDRNDTRPSTELPIVTDMSTTPLGEPSPAAQLSPSAFLLDSPIGPKPPTADLRRMDLNESLSGLGNDASAGKRRRGRKPPSEAIPVVRGPTTREQDLLAPAAPRRAGRRQQRAANRRAPQPTPATPLPPEALGLPLDVPIPRRAALGQVGRWALLGAVAVGGTVVIAEGLAHTVGNLFASKPSAQAAPPVVLGNHATAIQTLVWSPDSTRLASGALSDATILFWQPDKAGTPSSQLVTDATKGGVTDLSWSRDSHYLLISTAGTNAQIWNVGQQSLIQHPPYIVARARWHPVLNVAALVIADATAKTPPTNQDILIWDIANSKLLATLSGHAAAITALDWWPGTTDLLLASGDAAGTVIVWEGTNAATMAAGTHPTTSTTTAITDVRWAASSTHFTVGSQDGAVRLFDAHQAASLATWVQGKDAVIALAWQRAQNRVAVALANGSMQIWNAATNRLAATLPGAPTNLTGIAWSADARWLAAGAADGRILVWNTTNIG